MELESWKWLLERALFGDFQMEATRINSVAHSSGKREGTEGVIS
jgi:hypothetical protein